MFHRPRTLFFRDVEVGVVTPTDSDFPWMWGTFTSTLDPADATGDRGELQRYIEYSLEADRVMREQGDEAWEAFSLAHDERFEPFLIGDFWRLISADGDEWTATVVNFHSDGTVGWR